LRAQFAQHTRNTLQRATGAVPGDEIVEAFALEGGKDLARGGA
jgi:hypothetical protein